MQVFVRDLEGKTCTLFVDSVDNIVRVKQKVDRHLTVVATQ